MKNKFDTFENLQIQVIHLKKAVSEKDSQISKFAEKQNNFEKILSEEKREQADKKMNIVIDKLERKKREC